MRSHGSSLWGLSRQYILQGWFKMKTTSIFPVHGLASLTLMSKHAQSRQFFVGVSPTIYFTRLVKDENYQHISCSRTYSLKFDFEMRRHISILKRGYIVLYMDILQKQIVSILIKYSCVVSTMSENREPQIMLYFTDDNYVLQGWCKMRTTSIFPVHGLASLI